MFRSGFLYFFQKTGKGEGAFFWETGKKKPGRNASLPGFQEDTMNQDLMSVPSIQMTSGFNRFKNPPGKVNSLLGI